MEPRNNEEKEAEMLLVRLVLRTNHTHRLLFLFSWATYVIIIKSQKRQKKAHDILVTDRLELLGYLY